MTTRISNTQKRQIKRDARKSVFAASIKNVDYVENMVDSIARIIINDVVSEGMLFRDAFNSAIQTFHICDEDIPHLEVALRRHGWDESYNAIGTQGPRFNDIREYYLAPLDPLDHCWSNNNSFPEGHPPRPCDKKEIVQLVLAPLSKRCK